ncbi:vitamin K-dependent gamma-carboxylase-like protein [Flavobacteriaceae bacterium MAR_2010_105]|nr:vitamin K-dependent gamma-carboxylase-like protein [Flavobacteriaceae bacterium MAR_2010_105]
MNKFLFKHIDNSALIVFRICFGILVIFESFGAILTGWVKHTFIDPKFTFSFIPFEWLQPLPGSWMYLYYAIMGILGIFITLGYKYRWSIIGFTLLWSASYFMQKSSYNNHYYLLILLSGFMAIVPANRYLSIDVKLHPEIENNAMPNWCKWIFIAQLFIVYSYASIAKLYPDWLSLSVIEILMKDKQDYALVGDVLQQRWLHGIVAYGGILFDGLIVPLLLWKPTRKWAFMVSIVFHIFNSFIFQIGIFPYMSLALCLFFFEPKIIQQLFLKKKTFYEDGEVKVPNNQKPVLVFFTFYFLIQIALPVRHWFIKDDVLWTEEGHRLSWRMMLRSRSGITSFKVVDKASKVEIPVKLEAYLTAKQIRNVKTKPDMMWQFAQHLKRSYAKNGMEVEVYVNSYLKVNDNPVKPFIDPEVDLANVKWEPYKHSSWILPSKQD